jgi:transcription elongation factor Elf1
MKQQVMEYNELQGVAEFRFEEWVKKRWPKWDKMVEDIPEEFEGKDDCPMCGHSRLVMGYHPKPFCFSCNVPTDAANCENCGRTYLAKDGCCSIEEETDGVEVLR